MIRLSLTLALLLAGCSAAPEESRAAAPEAPQRLALLTSLPLVFGESFSLEGQGSAALDALEARWPVHAIPLADAANLQGHDLLLMAHPPVQTAEALVELDQWVRAGGRVLLLADPKLEWPSALPLGDRRRPPPWFSDTGLLGHWGLVLAGPEPDGPATREVGNAALLTVAPGRLRATKDSCAVEADGFVAQCRVGKGRVRVIADADFLNVDAMGVLDGPTDDNLPFLVDQLDALAR